jgi:phospholipid N-methyltransferase
MNPKRVSLKYKKIWQFPQDTHDFIKPMIKGKSLHVCCGNSLLCDIRVDIEKQEIQDSKDGFILGDMFDLVNVLEKQGIEKYSFDVVLCDPVWNLGYHVRHKLIYNLRDFVKPGGILIFNCLWFPKIKTMKLENMWVGLNDMAWRNVSLIGIYKKYQTHLP